MEIPVRMEIHPCKVSSTKEGKTGASGYLTKDVGKFTGGSCVYSLCFHRTENMKNGDYMAAFSYFQKAADRGYSKAQYNVGLCHEMAGAPPGTPGRYRTSFCPQAHGLWLHCP